MTLEQMLEAMAQEATDAYAREAAESERRNQVIRVALAQLGFTPGDGWKIEAARNGSRRVAFGCHVGHPQLPNTVLVCLAGDGSDTLYLVHDFGTRLVRSAADILDDMGLRERGSAAK